jgi:hypothetical protein
MEEEQVVDETTVEETDSQTVETEVPEITATPTVDPRIAELETKNKQLFERAKKAEAEAKVKKLEAEREVKSLDIEDFLDISASLEGLDQKEKEFLAKQHKLTGRPLNEIRNDEDFGLWQSAYRAKAEKERALKPSGTQADSERRSSFTERLSNTKSLAEQEKLLKAAGLYKETRPRSDRSSIG